MSVARAKAIVVAVALQLAAAVALRAQQPVESLFPARPTGFLTDAAGVVDAASAAHIDSIARAVQATRGADIAVVVLPTIGEREPAEVALAIGRRWGVGGQGAAGDPRRNAGVVVLLVPRSAQQRGRLRIEVGRGLEGLVTDAAAGRAADLMLPEIRAGQYGPGLVTGVSALATIIAGGMPEAPPAEAPAEGIPGWVVIVAVVVILAVINGAGRGPGGRGGRRVYWGGPPVIWGGGGFGGGGFGGGGGGFGGFGGGGGFSGGGAGRSF